MRRTHDRSFRQLLTAGAFVVLSGSLVGCFTTAADFQNDAEDFIEQNDELRAALFPDSDAALTTATCAEPPNQDEGTTFPCTATDTTGATWEFEIVITGSSEYEVNVARRPVES